MRRFYLTMRKVFSGYWFVIILLILTGCSPEFKSLWEYTTAGSLVTSPALDDDGVIYCATSIQDQIYLPVGTGYLDAVTSDGTLKWRLETDELAATPPAISSDGTIYFATREEPEGSSSTGYLYSVKKDGALNWKQSFLASGDLAIGSDGAIYACDDDYLCAFNPDSTVKWKYEGFTGTPTIACDGTIYCMAEDESGAKALAAINPDSTLKWNYGISNTIGSLAIGDDGTIYFTMENLLCAVSPEGNERWQFATSGQIRCLSPAINSDGVIFFGSDDSCFYAVNPDGSLNWKLKTDFMVQASPAIDFEGNIYVGASEWNEKEEELQYYLYALTPKGDLAWKYETKGPVNAAPLISNDGEIFIWTGDSHLADYQGGYLYGIQTSSSGLAVSSWPRAGHDNLNTRRVE